MAVLPISYSAFTTHIEVPVHTLSRLARFSALVYPRDNPRNEPLPRRPDISPDIFIIEGSQCGPCGPLSKIPLRVSEMRRSKRLFITSIVRIESEGDKRRYRLVAFSKDQPLRVLKTVPLAGKSCAYLLREVLGIREELLVQAKPCVVSLGHASFGEHRFTDGQLRTAGLNVDEWFKFCPDGTRFRRLD